MTLLTLTATLAVTHRHESLTCNDGLDWVDSPVHKHEAVWRVIIHLPPGIVVAQTAFAGAVAHLVRVFVHGFQALRLAQRLPVLRVVVQHLRGNEGNEGNGSALWSRRGL